MSYQGQSSALPSQALRVIVLEDDPLLRERILLPGLADHGFRVTGSATATELYRNMLAQRFDIAVLDIGVPDEDGLTVARHLRSMSNIGIVMLSASQARADRIQAMTDGADMFLSKPIDMEVLAASLHSLVRRMQSAATWQGAPKSPERVPVPSRGWHLETDGWCLLSPRGAVIALSVPERCIMQQLIARQGTPVSRSALIAALSQDVYEFDPHRLEMLVYRLRRKAGEQSGETLPLLTARGSGYVFAKGALDVELAS
ncbi:response regulator transcription factor [Dyella sp. GSA-30]|uniref:response regulator transcription factor n=1 Tax=Dyella sp. GSA-30 TaxID=2994496 RepID=UPI0024932D68|nr:response regulator transcription factor [Dyella sp. GSA-30]BDU20033.1 virulence transcriptional regulatory protein PhoP [Dyella sp. GSA-30]